MLNDEGTRVVKCFLNVSRAEQAQRFQDRLDDPTKRWKFRAADLADRKLWPRYREAYEDAIVQTSTSYAPWWVIPGDRNWVRNLAVAKILLATLREIGPKFPPLEPGVKDVTIV
jgi:polyphosphate kinase 2 (PPK2 family)